MLLRIKHRAFTCWASILPTDQFPSLQNGNKDNAVFLELPCRSQAWQCTEEAKPGRLWVPDLLEPHSEAVFQMKQNEGKKRGRIVGNNDPHFGRSLETLE